MPESREYLAKYVKKAESKKGKNLLKSDYLNNL